MENYVAQFFAVASLHLLALMSPGPDFIMITRNSLVYSRKAGVYSALGLACGILVHITYSLVGLAYIISQSVIVFTAIKFLGAAYLIYIGYKSLRAKPQAAAQAAVKEPKEMGRWEAVKLGFLTNVLNPKATLFFLALFTQFIHQNTPLAVKVVYGLEMSLMTFLWFAFVSVVLSHNKIKAPFIKVQHYVERTMGGLLILLGLKVVFSRK